MGVERRFENEPLCIHSSELLVFCLPYECKGKKKGDKWGSKKLGQESDPLTISVVEKSRLRVWTVASIPHSSCLPDRRDKNLFVRSLKHSWPGFQADRVWDFSYMLKENKPQLFTVPLEWSPGMPSAFDSRWWKAHSFDWNPVIVIWAVGFGWNERIEISLSYLRGKTHHSCHCPNAGTLSLEFLWKDYSNRINWLPYWREFAKASSCSWIE